MNTHIMYLLNFYYHKLGALINDNSSLIQDFYSSECENSVHLVVGTYIYIYIWMYTNTYHIQYSEFF
jgi:hypothetical protein